MKNYNQYFIENPEAITKCAGNTFYGRSGSYLMCTLFDSHPQVLSLPPNGYGSILLSVHKILENFYESSTSDVAEQLIESFQFLTKCQNATNGFSLINAPGSFVKRLGNKSKLEIGAEKEDLKKILIEILENIKKKKLQPDTALMLNAIHISYAIVMRRTITSKNVIIFVSLHSLIDENISTLSREYKDFWLLPSVRCPHKTHDSHLYHHMFEFLSPPYLWLLPHLISHLYHDGQKRFSFLESDKHIAVKFEDLHSQTELVMQRLCKIFDIEWDPILLESTIDGHTMWIDRKGKLYTGTNHKISQKNDLRLLKERDVFLLSQICKAYYKNWEYETPRYSQMKKVLFEFILVFPFLSSVFQRAFFMDFKRILSSPGRSRAREFISLLKLAKKANSQIRELIKKSKTENICIPEVLKV